MKISLIAAIGTNNELGNNGKLPWYLPKDFTHFKNTTKKHPVIMGRKTFEAIGKALPDRENIVITGDRTYHKEGIRIVHSLGEALALFKDIDEEVFIIGGAQIYEQTIPLADKLYITHVDGSFEADTFFPKIDYTKWEKIKEENYLPDEYHEYAFSICEYKKRTL